MDFSSVGCDSKILQGAGGKNPFLLVHDDHGRELISFSARYGDGLPSNVIPMQLDAIATFGHAEPSQHMRPALKKYFY